MRFSLIALALISTAAFAAGPQTQQCQGDPAGCKAYCENTLSGVYTSSATNSGSCTWTNGVAWGFKPKITIINKK